MTRPEEMQVPQNVRNEFSPSEINMNANAREASIPVVSDAYIPAQDPRSSNVAEKVAAGVPYHKVKDDKVSHEFMEKYVAEAISEKATEGTV